MLIGEHLTYAINHKTLVDDVSLDIAPGEIVGVIGANGAGKSTLLKLLVGDLEPRSGRVAMNNRPLADWGKRERAKTRAVLPQSTSLTFGFSVLEVVLIGRSPHVHGIERKIDYGIARQALVATKIDHLAERIFTTLSGGEKQRVQLARVLAQIWEGTNARYLMLDEPTNNLDLAHQHGTLQIARQVAGRGVGILAILHDLNLAAQYADRILIMHQGRCLAIGASKDVLTSHNIEAAFSLPVRVEAHPYLNCPLIIAVPFKMQSN
ncbi:MAG: heme ABC transporter ATP-binding protein [Anaerolineales bacterium]